MLWRLERCRPHDGATVRDMPHAPPSLALLGGPEPWPLAGHVRGALQGSRSSVAWVGRTRASAGPEAAWRASRALEQALTRAGPPEGERRRVLSVLWSRLETLEHLQDLVLLLAAVDADGAALSAVGLGRILGDDGGTLRSWLAPPHPLLGAPGLPERLPGVLLVQGLPRWLVALPADLAQVPLEGRPLDPVFARCGVHG